MYKQKIKHDKTAENNKQVSLLHKHNIVHKVRSDKLKPGKARQKKFLDSRDPAGSVF